uniref:Suppressor of cytokine signaling 7 n=1 Tax=Takifugu rubripes TaxID=31033 RepID=A0A674NEM5_TAKRU
PDPGSASVLCHRHRLVQWPPGLLDQALHLGLLEPQKNCPNDPVVSLAQRMGQLGEAREDRTGKGAETGLLRCSCHSVLASGSVGPGEDPTETSDALLVLEGLGSGEGGEDEEGGSSEKGETPGDVSGTAWGAGPVFSSGTLSGLMRQVHRLAEEAGVCTDQNCRSPLAIFGGAMSLPPCVDSHPPITSTVLQIRATTPKLVSGAAGRCPSPLLVLEREVGTGKEGEKTSRGKSRKGGSLKVRLSKLFRTKSSSGGSGGLLDKRPSLASSTSSGGSLLDVWGSTCSSGEQDSSRPHSAFSPVPFTPAFTGETVSLVDVDISRRSGTSFHPPTPPPPPRRSLSLLDDFGGPPQQQGPFTERSGGASMQSLPPPTLALNPSLSTIQHSLSLNALIGLPRPVPLRPNAQ